MAAGDSRLRTGLLSIVFVHLAVTLWHGAAHTMIPVPLTSLQTAFVGIVIVLLPLIGAGLLWTRRRLAAAWLITLSMLGSLLFGFVNHFVLDSPDHVSHVPQHAWRSMFVLSAVLVAITEAAGTALGFAAARKWMSGG